MLFLLRSDPESGQVVDLPDIEPKYEVGVDLGPVLEEADCDVAGAVRVDVGVLYDAALDLVLLMLQFLNLFCSLVLPLLVVFVKVVVFDRLLHPVDYRLHRVLLLHTVLSLKLNGLLHLLTRPTIPD